MKASKKNSHILKDTFLHSAIFVCKANVALNIIYVISNFEIEK